MPPMTESKSNGATSVSDAPVCIVCGGCNFSLVSEHPHCAISSAFKGINIVGCSDCSFEMCHPWPCNEGLAQFYDKDYENKMGLKYPETPLAADHFGARRASVQADFIRASAAHLFEGGVEGFEKAARVVAEGGPGWGRLLAQFAYGPAASGRTFHAFEYDKAALEYARNVECKDCDAKFVGHIGDCRPGEPGEDGGIPAGSVDLVLSSHVIEHIVKPEVTVQAWADLLKEGGILFLEGPLENPHPLNCGHYDAKGQPYYGGHLSFFKPEHYLKMIENAGLSVVRIETSMGPVNPVLEVDMPFGKAWSGQDRVARILARKPTPSERGA